MQNAWQPRALRSISNRAAEGDDVYIPHPAPNAVVDDDEVTKMGATLSLLKVSHFHSV
jgi:hypothetical protein